jgi:hypothetical protein
MRRMPTHEQMSDAMANPLVLCRRAETPPENGTPGPDGYEYGNVAVGRCLH